ncbi:putative F-box only protein 15 [Raphanus sativus]|nr:putative F-box only protein 15 [Raphanus sativus]
MQDDEEPREIVVWVTNKLTDVDVLFTKYFNVSRPDVPALLDHTDMSHSVYFIGKHKFITAWCEAEVYEDDDKNPPTCITLYEIDEGGVRTQLETERHYESGYSGTFLCGYVYVPSLVPLPE